MLSEYTFCVKQPPFRIIVSTSFASRFFDLRKRFAFAFFHYPSVLTYYIFFASKLFAVNLRKMAKLQVDEENQTIFPIY